MNRRKPHGDDALSDLDADDPRYYGGEGYEGDLYFADPTGYSALRASSPSNPRNLPCPTCGVPNRLTMKDKALGYQCDYCADRDEGGGYGRGDY